MYKIFLALLMSFSAIYGKAQETSEADIKKAAEVTCECLEKEKISDEISSIEAQAVFSKCLITAAPEIMMKMTTQENMFAAAAELGEQLLMQMIANGCSPVKKIITAMSADMNSGNPFLPPGDSQENEKTIISKEDELVKTAEGTVILLEEKEFLTITIKTGSGRELKFLYYSYVNGSDEWVRNAAAKLKNRKVSISYVEEEVYQPAIKEFTQVKIISALTIE